MDDKKKLICAECGTITITRANPETCPLCKGRLRGWEGYRRASGQGPRRPTPADAAGQLERDIQEYLRGVGDAEPAESDEEAAADWLARREVDELERPFFKAGPRARRAIDRMFDAIREAERTRGIEVAIYRAALGIAEAAVDAKDRETLMATMLLAAEALRRFAAEGGE